MKNKIVKTYTDLSQSKKLAEILPLGSADLDYIPVVNLEGEYSLIFNVWNNEHEDSWIPCWSLAALLEVLPDEMGDNHYLTLDKEGKEYCCCYEDCNGNSFRYCFSDNPVDACYEMIIRLHEENLI